jgi:hypothetical protein
MVQDILWKADSRSDCQKTAYFLYGNQRFITVWTKARTVPYPETAEPSTLLNSLALI